MATKTVTAPAVIKIKNNSTVSKVFAPYKENFPVTLAANGVIELQLKTSGQILYYLEQATKDLSVEILNDFDATVGAIKIYAQETVTLTNNSAKTIGFIPYKENFQYNIGAGDAVSITTSNAGQVLYYLGQATEGLTVTHVQQV